MERFGVARNGDIRSGS